MQTYLSDHLHRIVMTKLTIKNKVHHGRIFQCGEGWHSNENAVRFWIPSPRVPKETDARCYACTTAYALMIPRCNVC
jgi:hypothetical protein